MNGDFKEMDSERIENINKNVEIITDLIDENCTNSEEHSDLMNSIFNILATKISNILINDPESNMLSVFNEMVELHRKRILDSEGTQ